MTLSAFMGFATSHLSLKAILTDDACKKSFVIANTPWLPVLFKAKD
jgi:hypothetical protein